MPLYLLGHNRCQPELVAAKVQRYWTVRLGDSPPSSYVSVPNLLNVLLSNPVKPYFSTFRFFICICEHVCSCVHVGGRGRAWMSCRGQKTTLMVRWSPSTFTWVPDITLSLSQQVFLPTAPSYPKVNFFLKNWEDKPTKRWCYAYPKQAFNLLTFL